MFSQQESLYLTYIIQGCIGEAGYKHFSAKYCAVLRGRIRKKVAQANKDLILYHSAVRMPDWHGDK